MELHDLTQSVKLFLRQLLVFDLCSKIFPTFSKEDHRVASALLNRRNEELHSGAAAFDHYDPSYWLVDFYHACQSLTTMLGETLADLYGEDEATFAERLLAENRDNLKNTVLSSIAAHRNSFSTKEPDEQIAAGEGAGRGTRSGAFGGAAPQGRLPRLRLHGHFAGDAIWKGARDP